jgi:hypothetical protein
MRDQALRRAALAASLAIALAGCGADRFGDYNPFTPKPAASSGHAVAAPIDMNGRWMLASQRGQCAMTFRGTPGAAQGSVAPEGGCPGDFFTSRHWVFERDGLVIRNHNGEPLGQFAIASAARFDGRSIAGEAMTLTR